MSDLAQQFAEYLGERQAQGLYRQRVLSSDAGENLDFSCNDYLSLTTDARVRQAFCKGFERYPVGSGGSMVLSGYHAPHRQLEQDFAQALGVDDCLLFSSGYAANLSVVSLLAQFGAHCLIDKSVHASVYDGLTLAKAKYSRFLHNNLHDLQKKLALIPNPTAILTESTFSMSGLHAPLTDIAGLAPTRDVALIVDEAHGFGVMGPQGLGGVSAAGLTQVDVPLRVIPFGKAMAGSGAIVAGQALWIDALLQATRQPIYSTAISPALAYGLREVLLIIQQSDDRRAYLRDLITYFRERARTSSFRWRDSVSPIQQLQVGCPYIAMTLAQTLQAQQIRCCPIRQPTVSKQETGLRIILNYHHTQTDIDRLFRVLQS